MNKTEIWFRLAAVWFWKPGSEEEVGHVTNSDAAQDCGYLPEAET